MEASARPASAAVRFPAFAFAHVSWVVLCSGGDDDNGDDYGDDDGDDDGGGSFAGEPCRLLVSVFFHLTSTRGARGTSLRAIDVHPRSPGCRGAKS